MGLCNLDSAIIVNNATLLVYSVPSAAHSCAWLIGELSFLVLLHDCLSISVEIKVSSHQVRIEVVLFDIEGSRYLSLLVELALLEHCSSIQVVDDVACLLVDEIASLVCQATILIPVVSILVLCRDHIAFLIAVKSSDYIAFVEPPRLGSGRALDAYVLTSEVLEGIALDHHEGKV